MGRTLFQDAVTALPDSGVTAGPYTNADITVNSQGLITVAADGSAGVTTLDGLTDVNVSAATEAQVLKLTSGVWGGDTLTITDLDDVVVTTPVIGEILSWDGSDWINQATSTLDGVALDADIGTTIQAWDAQLDGLATLDGVTGLIVQTGVATFTKRSLAVGANAGLVIANGDGVAANPTLSIDITVAVAETTIDPVNDLILFHDATVSGLRKAAITDIVTAAESVSGASNVGTGAAPFKTNNAGSLEFRSIDNGNSGITIALNGDTIEVSAETKLNAISLLAATDSNFLVGNGTTWVLENPATARTSLALGTMAVEADTDFLRLTGGTVTGNITMSTSTITGLPIPAAGTEAASKDYVDSQVIAFVGGDGIVITGSTIDVVANGDGSITVNANDIQLNTTFTDGLYHTQTELNSTTPSSEGAALIGTDTKTNLNNATDVEVALTFLDAQIPLLAVAKFQMELTGTWNLDVGGPTVSSVTVNDVEVARFPTADDVAIYRDLMLPPDFDNTQDLTLHFAVAKEAGTAGSIRFAVAVQHQRTPGFGADVVQDFDPGATTAVNNLSSIITASGFQALDTMTIRLSRLGAAGEDTYASGADFFSAYLTQ